MAICESQFGGRVSLKIGSLQLKPTEADIRLKTSQVSVEARANQDGSACYIVKPMLVSAEFTFRRPLDVSWTDTMLLCSIDGTIVEEDNGRTHLFTGTRFIGDPDENITNGEVSGLKIEGGRYQQIAA
jgi:hypothetical protein